MGKGRLDEPRNEDVTQMQNRAEKQITPTPSKQTSRRRMQTNQGHRRQSHTENCGLQTITASGTKREMAIKRLGEVPERPTLNSQGAVPVLSENG